MLLIDYARNEIGLQMKGVHGSKHCGWTTDAGKAELMRTAGAHLRPYVSLDRRPEARKFDGWDVSFAIGAEKAEAVAA